MVSFKFWGKGADASATGRTPAGKQAPAESPDAVTSLRRRARNRLVGAVVLVLVAIVGFPLLFETQPRPDAVNTKVTIPDQKTTPAAQAPQTPAGSVAQSSGLDAGEQVVPSGTQGAAGSVGSVPQPDSTPAESNAAPVTGETSSPVIATPPASVAPPEASPTTNAAAADQAEAVAQQKAAQEAAQKAEQARRERAAAEKLAAQKVAAQKAAAHKAALEKAAAERAAAEKAGAAKTAAAEKALSGAGASAEKGRFLIQIGAYADAGSANSARASAGFLGVSTYSEQVKTSAGVRTRVRAGPFTSRAAADAVASKLKHGGMTAQVLPG